MHRPSRCRYLSIYLSVCLSVYLSIYLPTYLLIHLGGLEVVLRTFLFRPCRGKRENSKSSSADSMAKPEKYRKVLKSGELATVLESKSTHFSRKVDHCHGILGWCISEPLHAINWHTVQQINSFHLDCGRIFWNPPKGRNLKGYMAVPKVVTISNLKVLQRSWAKQTNQTVMAVESWTLSSLYYILWSPTDF